MRARILLGAVLTVFSATVWAQANATPTDVPAASYDKDKASYSLGVNIGRQIKDSLSKQPLDLAMPSLSQGVTDVLNNSALKYTDAEVSEQMKSLQTKALQQEEEKIQKAALDQRATLFNSTGYPVAGNPKGDVTVVEFFDYRCPYCIRMQPTINALLKSDKNVRIIYRDFPILGPASQAAAQLALIAETEKKYVPTHDALMALQGKITKESLMETAKKVGIKVNDLQKIVTDKPATEKLINTAQLARNMGLKYTPGFFIAPTPGTAAANRKEAALFYVSGAKTEAEMQDLVNKARKG